MDINLIGIIVIAFSGWMVLDCLQRKEHIVWIIIIIALIPPIGALVYFFAVKAQKPSPVSDTGKPMFQRVPKASREIDTEETLQLKELINQFHKAYHYEKLGQIYLEQKKYDLAVPQFRSAIEKDQEMEEAHYGLGKSLYGMGDYEEAAKTLEVLVGINRKYDYGNAIFGLAECYRLAENDEKAMETYEEVIKTFDFFKAKYHYARLLDKKGDKQGAIGSMKSIIGSSKDLPDYKLEKERHWIDEAYKFLRKNGVELA